MLEKIKNISLLFALFTSIIGGSYAIDSRYALASDLEETKSQLLEAQKLNENLIKSYMKEQRVQTLQDKIFDIQIKGELNNIDKARIERWKNELNYIQSN